MGTEDCRTHEQRSSGMSLALRWTSIVKKRWSIISKWPLITKRLSISKPSLINIRSFINHRWWITSFVSVVMMALFIMIFQVAAVKHVTLVINGEEQIVETRKSSVGAILAEQGIEVNEYDRVSAALDERIKSGDTIEVRHAIPVRLTVDGETKTHYTIGRTVKEAVRDLSIVLGPEDRLLPAPHAPIDENSEIEIVRVISVYEQQERVLPYQTITKQDPSLTKGKERVIQHGKDGVLVSKVKKVYENGVLVAEHVVEETVKEHSQDEIVAVGTKNPVVILSASSPAIQTVSKDGMTFEVKQILDNVTLTAYDAGLSSTGKDKDHPLYGITYTGSKVQEGRTVAVDPQVIPLGWWIYIEGIGLRRAEDIGSAVKGKKIDLYVESEEEANRFGTKRGYTVYIIGPNKPE